MFTTDRPKTCRLIFKTAETRLSFKLLADGELERVEEPITMLALRQGARKFQVSIDQQGSITVTDPNCWVVEWPTTPEEIANMELSEADFAILNQCLLSAILL